MPVKASQSGNTLGKKTDKSDKNAKLKYLADFKTSAKQNKTKGKMPQNFTLIEDKGHKK